MADPTENNDDSVSLSLYRACDWSAARSWLTLLGLGLTVGTVSALLGGLVTVFLLDRTVATIDAEFLAYGARIMFVALIFFGFVFAMIEVCSILWAKRDRDFRWTRQGIELMKGRRIASVLQLIIIFPPFVALILLFDPDQPGGDNYSTSALAVAIIAAVIIGPRIALVHLTHGNPPSRDIAD